MEIIILEVLLTLLGSIGGFILGTKKEKTKPNKIDKIVYSKRISNRNLRINNTNNKDLRYINTSNIEFIFNNSFISFKDYYNIDTNIIFDFTDHSNIKEYLLDIKINELSGIYFKGVKERILPTNVFKTGLDINDISSLIKINNLEELNLLLKDIDKENYSMYISAYFEQIKRSFVKDTVDITIDKKKTLSLQK